MLYWVTIVRELPTYQYARVPIEADTPESAWDQAELWKQAYMQEHASGHYTSDGETREWELDGEITSDPTEARDEP